MTSSHARRIIAFNHRPGKAEFISAFYKKGRYFVERIRDKKDGCVIYRITVKRHAKRAYENFLERNSEFYPKELPCVFDPQNYWEAIEFLEPF